MLLPPPDRLKRLSESADIGDIVEIRNILSALQEDEPRLRPFVNQLQPLVREFKMDEIQQLLKDYVIRQHASPVAAAPVALPDDLRQRLHDALVIADTASIHGLLKEVRALDAGLAAEFAGLLHNFEYDRIVARLYDSGTASPQSRSKPSATTA